MASRVANGAQQPQFDTVELRSVVEYPPGRFPGSTSLPPEAHAAVRP